MSKTHFVRKLAMFDQFPYTEHIESGAIFEKIIINYYNFVSNSGKASKDLQQGRNQLPEK